MSQIEDMIQSGSFGTTGPIGYNPYAQPNNIVQFGGYQPPQQPIFQPIPQQQDYYNPYASSFGNRANYYNPYGVDYRYNNYNPYAPYGTGTMSAYQKAEQERIELLKIKYRCRNKFMGIDMSEEELDRIVNPRNPANMPSSEQIEIQNEFDFVQRLDQAAQQEQKPMTQQMVLFNKTMSEVAEFHKTYDNHSLCEFLEKDSGVIRFNNWIEKNCKPNTGKDMSDTYDSESYNELLRMHRASSSPYTISLLNQTYDNNIDDYEIGMKAAQDREHRRRAILSGKVPDFISSPQVQESRHQWTQQVLNQIYGKEAIKNV